MKTLMKKVIYEERLKAKFYRNLEKFLTDGTSNRADKQIVKDIVEELADNEKFNPVLYWKFTPVCTCEATLPDDDFSVRYKPLFKCNGKLLSIIDCKEDNSNADIADRNEIWLLEDMTFAVVHCTEMTRNDNERLTCRFVVGHKFSDFYPGFDDVRDILNEIDDLIETHTDMYEE